MDSRLRGNDEIEAECDCADVQEQDAQRRSDWHRLRHPREGGDPVSLETVLRRSAARSRLLGGRLFFAAPIDQSAASGSGSPSR
jgi:hypothetical protein